MELDRDSTSPLYLQLYTVLKNDLENGVYKKGERIPTEAELSQKYGVSRITLRNALDKLVRDNYLVRYRGRGTFVKSEKYTRSIAENLGFTEMCHRLGCTAGAKTIKPVIENATKEDIEELQLAEGANVFVLERIRYMNNVPVALECGRYTDQYSFLMEEDLNTHSLYQLLAEKYQMSFGDCTRRIEITYATYRLSKYLNVPIDYPLLYMYGIVYDNDGRPAYRNQQYIVGDKFTLTL